MTNKEPSFDQLLTSIEERERKSRRNTLVWTAIPVAAAFVLLGYSSWRLATASEEVRDLGKIAEDYKTQAQTSKDEVAGLTVRIDGMRAEASSLREQLEDTEKLLRQTLEFSQYRFVLDPVDVKTISSRFPRESKILRFIIELRERDVGWKLGGRTPQQGFDSPSFAQFVLRKFDLGNDAPTNGLSLVAASRRLYQTLPETDDPKPGDLAFYPSGYVMFYFVGRGGEPFVIGMTPFGIASFKADFARVLGYRRAQ